MLDSPSGPATTRARVDEETGASTQALRQLDLTGRAVLLASDGSPGALAAAQVANALARTHHAKVHVVSVVDTRAGPIPAAMEVALAMGAALTGPELHRDQERSVRSQLEGAIGATVDWPVRVMLGSASTSIVQEAKHVHAALVILGLRRHGRLDRAVHDETTLNVMRNASCPVFGVVSEMHDLPARMLAAVDFSLGSLIAVRSGLAIARDGATLTLAYVRSMNGVLLDEGESRIHDMGVETGFAKLNEKLGHDGVTFDHVVLHHAPEESISQALLDYADEIGCDLITAGSVQHSRLERWMVGSVSSELVRDGRRSVLIVPPRPANSPG